MSILGCSFTIFSHFTKLQDTTTPLKLQYVSCVQLCKYKEWLFWKQSINSSSVVTSNYTFSNKELEVILKYPGSWRKTRPENKAATETSTAVSVMIWTQMSKQWKSWLSTHLHLMEWGNFSQANHAGVLKNLLTVKIHRNLDFRLNIFYAFIYLRNIEKLHSPLIKHTQSVN